MVLGCTCMLSHFSHVPLCNPMNYIACQAALSMGFSRQEYWSVLLCPPPGDLPDPEIKPGSLMSPALAGRFFTISITQVPSVMHHNLLIFWSVSPQDPIVLDGWDSLQHLVQDMLQWSISINTDWMSEWVNEEILLLTLLLTKIEDVGLFKGAIPGRRKTN